MGIKIKAIERNVSFSKKEEEADYRFVMQTEMYNQLSLEKAIEQASLASGLPKPVINASLTAYGNMLKTWCTEGHSIPIPGIGIMRFGLRSTAVKDVTKVSASLITSRRVIFIPSVEVKQALADTSVNITCYDRTGKVVKSVTSSDKSDIEDPEGGDDPNGGGSNPGGGSSSGEGSGSSTGGSSTSGGGSTSGGSGDMGL